MISIITTFFNAEKYLDKCILSVQEVKNLDKIEHILINDGSNDGSEKLVKSLSKENQVLINSNKIGRGPALNLGLLNAKNDLICILDSDDVINPDWLDLFFTTNFQNLVSEEDNFVFFGRNEIINNNGELKNPIIFDNKRIAHQIFNTKKIFFYNPIPHLGVVFRKDINSNLIYSNTLSSQLDWDLWFQIMSAKKRFIYFDIPTGKKRIHKDQSFERKSHMRYTLAGVNLQILWTWRLQPTLLPFVLIMTIIRMSWALVPSSLRSYVYARKK